MNKKVKLQTRILYQSLLITVLTVVVFVGGTLVNLRYGFKRTLDTQLDLLGPYILKQLSARSESLQRASLPVMLTLFDDQNPVRILRLETIDGVAIFDNPLYTKLIADYIEERTDEDKRGSSDRIQTLWSEGRTLRVAQYETSTHRLYMAADLAQVDKSLRQILIAFILMFPISVMGSILASQLLARRVTDPLASLAKQAQETSPSELNQRISIKNATTEIETLVKVLNEMMDRLDQSFLQARRFSADASHELKTPLTVMHTLLEQKLSCGDDVSITREEISQLMSETNRMRMIVEALLVLAKADENSLLQVTGEMALMPILEDLLEDASAMGESEGVSVQLTGSTDRQIKGDERLIRLALYNLIKNGIEHATPESTLDLICRPDSDHVVVSVYNQGHPISETEKQRIFERFYRGDQSRVRQKGKGLGLGLNIAHEIARAHGGEVFLEKSDASATLFSMRLPLV